MDSVRINSSLETLCYEGNRKHPGDTGKLVVKGGGSFKEGEAKASLKVYTEILIWGDSAPREHVAMSGDIVGCHTSGGEH